MTTHRPEESQMDRYSTDEGYEERILDAETAAAEPSDFACEGHPAGEFDRMGETVYCDGSCAC